MGKRYHHIFSAIFNWILFIFAGNEDMHKSLDEFEIRPDATTCFHGNRSGNSGKNGASRLLKLFDRIHFVLTGNDDIH